MKLILTLLFVNTLFFSCAQSVDIPKKEFNILLPEGATTLGAGTNEKLDIRILKSRSYQKGKVKMGVSSSLPAGIKITFDPEEGNGDLIHATITALPNTPPGVYSIIISATIHYKTKGSILKVTVT